MTFALCFNCGEIKWGAINPCSECGVSSSGDISLDISFSDHYLSYATLQQLGAVIEAIHAVCDDERLRAISFFVYVSTRHSGILDAQVPPEMIEKVEEILAKADLPIVNVEFISK